MPVEERIVAVGLLTARDLEVLGAGFHRVYPVQETPCFGELLRAIDEVDRELRAAGSQQGTARRPRSRPTIKSLLI